jgi:aminopeptidase YwaD
MHVLLILIIILISCQNTDKKETEGNGQADPKIQTIVDLVSKDSLKSHIEKLTTYQSRYVTNLGKDSARNWIKSKLESYGYTVTLQKFSTSQQTDGYNIIVNTSNFDTTKSHIILDAHYDSRESSSPHNVAPGASDNGSGVSILIETARIFKDLDFSRQIRYVFFDAEEIGLEGSKYYAQNAKTNNHKIDFVFNIDMVGGQIAYESTHGSKQKIVCEEDQDKMGNVNTSNTAESKELNKELVSAVNLYSNIEPKVDYAFSSDYEEFEHQGFVIIGLYEDKGQNSPHYHQSTDLISNMNFDFFHEVSKSAIAFLAIKMDIID